ncbi:COG3650 family protein [Anabaena sp. WFMT]|uniref:COG3650 family protein n=1 Tax=Anabaena sp. WFMT TaxID=3449730 RepID=UPI003F1F1974
MKFLTSAVTILGIGANLLVSDPSIAQSSKIEEFIASGTEPFWSVTVGKSGIIYASPEMKQQTFPYTKPLKAEGRPTDVVRVYRFRDRENNILILKKVSSCSDGMSDINYPYSAVFILGNKVLEGCAVKK